VSGVQLLSPPSAPVDAVASAPINTLLTIQWERNLSNETQSKLTFERASKNNSTLLVAYAINRLHQNKTRESKMIAEQLTTSYPDNLDGWMLKTWFNTLEDNFDAALVDMRSLKQKIDKTKNLPDATKILIYKRLGRLVGYFQGPVADRVNRDMLDSTIVAIADGIGPDALKAFNENHDKTLQTYDNLLHTQANRTQAELDKVSAENEQERISLERQNQILEQTESQLIPERERIRSAASQQIAILEQQGSSIQQQRDAIWSEIQDAQVSLQFMYTDLIALSNRRNGYYVSTYPLRNQIRIAEYDIAVLRNNGDGLLNQLNSIQSQIAQIQNTARMELNQLDREIKRVNGEKRRNLGKLARIARGPEIAEGKKGSMKNRATSLVTYDELSEELYRQQILDHLTVN
jgi:hypothetical protein